MSHPRRCMADFAKLRKRMVATQIVRRGVRDKAVLAAMREVPRERFVPEGMEEFAYEDSPLAIGHGQTISQPYIVAAMIEAAEIDADDRVLEVGAGSGYAAAVVGRIAARVFAVERHETLGRLARQRIEALGSGNVEVHIGDGSLGLPQQAPFDAIIVSAGGPEVPRALKAQLKVGGTLVVPVGERGSQSLCKVTRTGAGSYEEENLGAVTFVPLIGEQGWSEDEHRAGAARTKVPGGGR